MQIPREAWGNRGGWITASIIGVVLIALAWTLAGGGAATAATDLGRNDQLWSDVSLPQPVRDVADDLATADGTATYDAIIDRATNDTATRRAIEAMLDPRRNADATPEVEALLDRLVREAANREATIFADEPEKLVNHDRDLRELEALHDVGQAALRQASELAQRVAAGETERADAARELYAAAAMLGVHLTEERLVHRQWELGARLVSGGLGGLSALDTVTGNSEAAEPFTRARLELAEYVRATTGPVWDAIGTANTALETDQRAETHFGDVAAIARSDAAAEMWRTEALLRLGKYRYGATRRPDRAAADRIVAQFAEALPEGPAKLAAQRSRDLTAEEFRIAR